MMQSIGRAAVLGALAIPGLLAGCASSERAFVSIGYVLEPNKGLPPGMKAVSVMDARVNEVTDRKWSELAANTVQDLIQDANHKFGTGLLVADRKHLAEGMAEQDLAAAGITKSDKAGQGGQVMATQGIIESEINVKVETHVGKEATITGIGGWGGRGAGGGDIQTGEVETVARNITVQTTFKLVDTVNNRNWITYSPEPYSQFDKTEASPLFGSSKTEAELTPRDEVIGAAVAKGTREFVSQFVPCEMRYEVWVNASGNKNCQNGVKYLRAEAYGEALSAFKLAMAEDPGDDRAAYGAGVALEAMGNHDEALNQYRKAYGMKPEPAYRDAKERLSDHVSRIRKAGPRT